jgi:cobalt-zinc-cadmium efflux system membrane fusion protein
MDTNDARTPSDEGAPSGERAETANATGRHARSRSRALLLAAGALLVVALVAFLLWPRGNGTAPGRERAAASDEHGEEHAGEGGGEVELAPEAIAAAKIEIEGVTVRPAVAPLRVTGTVESNQQQTQQVTPLVSGRIERVYGALGDVVRAGAPLALISSPEVAEMHGKLLEAETRLNLAVRNLERIKRAENRAAVLTAKARLDEAEATLRRTRRLLELGAGAGKDLTAAETAHTTAKAEYDFQSNIALNREVAGAQAELETARTEADHLRQSLRVFGDTTADRPGSGHGISHVTLRAPISGSITERLVNAGAVVEAGRPLFTIGNLSTVWVIANVPEAQVGLLRVGASAAVRSAAAGVATLSGSVDYIAPRLDEQTRTARVRVEVPNPGERLKAGMFVEVGFEAWPAGSGTPEAEELVVPSEAVQRVGERTVVFIPKDDEPGHFEVRDVEVGGEIDGYRRVVEGLSVGEKVVTEGSFTLKTQMMKGAMGEHGH